MEYPVNIEKMIEACRIEESSPAVEALLRSVIPLVNEAYEKGRRDAGRMV